VVSAGDCVSENKVAFGLPFWRRNGLNLTTLTLRKVALSNLYLVRADDFVMHDIVAVAL